MAVVRGDVDIGVNVRGGQGDGVKKVDDAKTAVDKLKGSADGAGTSALSLNQRIGALKEGVAPVNKVREGFENLRSNAMFVVGAVASVASGLVSLADTLSTNAQAIRQWEEVQGGVVSALERTSELIEAIEIKIGKRQPKSDLEELAERMMAAWSENEDKIRKATEAVRAHEERVETALRLYGEYMPATQGEIKALERAQHDLNDLIEGQAGLLRTNIGLMNEMKRVAGEAFRQDLLEAGGQPFFVKYPAKGDPGGGPRRGGRTTPPSNLEGLDALLGLDLSDDVLGDYLASVRALEESSGGQGIAGAGKGALGGAPKGPSGAQQLAGDIRDFTAALSESIPMMSEWSGALAQISQLWGDYAESGKGAARATVLSVGAIAMAGAEQIKNEQLRAGVLSVIHLGLGTALMFVPGAQQEAIGHLTGAAILGSVAIFGGGGGAGSSRGSSSSSSRSLARPLSERQTSGNTTVVINGTYIAGHSAQETAAELHALGRRGVGGGFVPAGG